MKWARDADLLEPSAAIEARQPEFLDRQIEALDVQSSFYPSLGGKRLPGLEELTMVSDTPGEALRRLVLYQFSNLDLSIGPISAWDHPISDLMDDPVSVAHLALISGLRSLHWGNTRVDLDSLRSSMEQDAEIAVQGQS